MPIFVNGKEIREVDLAKSKRPKYTLNSEKTDESYEESKIIINGQEKTLSKSSKYLLDMISDEE